ncbi:MAG: hypothetical protein M3497_07140 [Gemmatimonadota bacterium]|nr:hypothetical protein [Gemmatimonadota bacterium]
MKCRFGGSAHCRYRTRMPRIVSVAVLVCLGLQAACSGPSTAASVSFRQVLADQEVRHLLERYNVQPYEVRLRAGEATIIHEVRPDSASPKRIVEARRKAVEYAREPETICSLGARLRETLRHDPSIRPWPGERNSRGRTMLAAIQRARWLRPRLERGEPAIYGLKVFGRSKDLQRLTADPRVRVIQPAQRLANRGPEEWFVPDPLLPNEGHHRPPSVPEIEALSEAEVEERLQRLASESLPECREWDRNHDPWPFVRLSTGTAGASMNGLRFRAETRMQAPGSVRGTVTVTNTSNQAVDVRIQGCTVMLRAYHAPERPFPPVWKQSRGMGCPDTATRLSLTPRASRQFATTAETWQILGELVPAGRYHFSVLFRLADQTLELPAGIVELKSPHEGLAYRATTRLVPGTPDTLMTRVTAANITRRPIHIEYGGCALQVRAYRSAARSGQPVWRSEGRQPVDGTSSYTCPLYAASATIAPDESFSPREFSLRVPVPEVLADSLLNGRYHFSVSLHLNRIQTPAFPAGEAELALRRPSLAATRTAESITYRANTEATSASPLIIRTQVTAVPAHPGGARLRYSADCPVILFVYHSRARRDAAPRSGEPDWRSARSCQGGFSEEWLNGGQSWTLGGEATTQEILGDSLPPGRYYFAAVVQTDRQRVFLSAGEANLAR